MTTKDGSVSVEHDESELDCGRSLIDRMTTKDGSVSVEHDESELVGLR